MTATVAIAVMVIAGVILASHRAHAQPATPTTTACTAIAAGDFDQAENDAVGTVLQTDLNSWRDDVSNGVAASERQQDAAVVRSDCAAAGVSVFGK